MDCTGIIVLTGIIVVIIFVVGWVKAQEDIKRQKEQQKEQQRKLNEAKKEYYSWLAHLKQNPTNADVREETLRLGRIYADFTRNQSGVTIYDEIALMNDINAACAGATVQVNPQIKTHSQSVESIEDRLAKLSSLRYKGVIDENEYSERKRKILDEI